MEKRDAFKPPGILKNSLLQTILASSRIRTIGKGWLAGKSRNIVLESDEGVRLLGVYTPHIDSPSRGLVILLHGWEGSSDSTYIVSTGSRLYRAGFDIFRLNFRDHGPSHHLNQGLFFAAHLDEVFQCTKKAAAFAESRPVFLMGFSLGGNFALRIAAKAAADPVPGLRRIFCISPVLDPDKSTDRADGHPLIRRYFLQKWRRSLRRKQRLFPDRYDFREVMDIGSIRGITQWMLDRHSNYGDCRDYFGRYALLDDRLQTISLPTAVITSKDDPIIPVSDFFNLVPSPHVTVHVTDYGGHNGFIQGRYLHAWYESVAIRFFGAT